MSMTRNDLTLEENIQLLKDRDDGLTYIILAKKYNVSLGSISNIVKRWDEYVSDYANNQNKESKRKTKNDKTKQDRRLFLANIEHLLMSYW